LGDDDENTPEKPTQNDGPWKLKVTPDSRLQIWPFLLVSVFNFWGVRGKKKLLTESIFFCVSYEWFRNKLLAEIHEKYQLFH